MAVSGLVIHLTGDEQMQEAVVKHLALDPRFEIGQSCGSRLPVVVSADSGNQGRDICERLARLKGVGRVDVVFVEYPTSPQRHEGSTCPIPTVENQ